MPDYDHYYSQFFGEGIIFKWLAESGLSDWNIMGTNSAFRNEQKQYLEKVGAKYDYRGEQHQDEYAVVFICSDLMVPKNFTNAKIVFVQEGMTDPIDWKSRMIQRLSLPAWIAGNTSLNGCSNTCDLYCVASQGYAQFFEEMGTDRRKIHITGIPNFDHAASFFENDFPYRDYVLVCTSDIREVGGDDDRLGFLRRIKELAEDREVIFRLHPNEKYSRAFKEIQSIFGVKVKIFQDGNTDHMIANCEELFTQYSSVIYIGMALGKKVHSYFSMDMLKARLPVQNGGMSAKLIAELVREQFLEAELEFSIDSFTYQNPQWAFYE